jgi:excisionase family DNA binding protein
MNERLLKVAEAAAILGVQPSTLYGWAYARRIPTVKLFGKVLRFKESDLERLIKGSVRPALKDVT